MAYPTPVEPSFGTMQIFFQQIEILKKVLQKTQGETEINKTTESPVSNQTGNGIRKAIGIWKFQFEVFIQKSSIFAAWDKYYEI